MKVIEISKCAERRGKQYDRIKKAISGRKVQAVMHYIEHGLDYRQASEQIQLFNFLFPHLYTNTNELHRGAGKRATERSSSKLSCK